jgi:antitoxin component YwqK of YwqJK toxin-antitoxin module
MMLRVNIEDCELDDDFVLFNETPLSGVLYSTFDGGEIHEEMDYCNGLPHGQCREFFSNGSLQKEWQSVNGRAEGLLLEWAESGVQILRVKREFGVVTERERWAEGGDKIESWTLEENSPMAAYLEKCRKELP